ncbi:MAG: hypothetical protein CTY16_01600 [Methylobacter sp.]|nr:MAG: hypothetical protein CTY16_01600 [Methylobacter sp.]
MKKILVIGNSHIAALRTAKTVDETFAFHSIKDKLADVISGLDPDNYGLVIISIAGNDHNVFGLLNHPQPFDFYLPENPHLPINPDARLLPASLVSKTLQYRMASIFSATPTLLGHFKKPIYQIESPPPIPSDAHIQKYPGKFKNMIAQQGVSPAAFRYKLWRLHSKIVSDHCQKRGIFFIEAPKEAQDAQGYLQEQYWNLDSTHGNALYGDLVLNQIRAIHNMGTQSFL